MNATVTIALQILVVATLTPESTTGMLQRYERSGPEAAWRSVGVPIRVSVGAGGTTKDKREGDQKTPIGQFQLGTALGSASSPGGRWPYHRVQKGDVCVDDPGSRSYGQLLGVDTALPTRPDWKSAEDLRLYRRAILVEYNLNPASPGRGSCIFLHTWARPDEPTLGCTAMGSGDLDELIRWLDPKSKPAFLIGVAASPSVLLDASSLQK